MELMAFLLLFTVSQATLVKNKMMHEGSDQLHKVIALFGGRLARKRMFK